MSYSNILAAATLGAVAVATGAFAAPPQLNDGSYIEAERCQALIASSALGRENTAGIDDLLKSENRGRDEAAYERGQDAHQQAAREARVGGAYTKSQLIAERDGVCQGFAAGPTMASAASHGASRSN